MRKSVMIFWFVTITAIIFHGFSQRYMITSGSNGEAFKIDRLTGKIWWVIPKYHQIVISNKEVAVKDFFSNRHLYQVNR